MLVFRGTNRDTSRIPNGSDASRTEPKSSESTRTSPRNSDQSPTLVEAREAYERDYILKKIDEHHGNVSRAAESLGLERSHLYRKMKALSVKE